MLGRINVVGMYQQSIPKFFAGFLPVTNNSSFYLRAESCGSNELEQLCGDESHVYTPSCLPQQRQFVAKWSSSLGTGTSWLAKGI